MGQFSALDCEPGDWESVRLWFQVLGHILRLISMQCIDAMHHLSFLGREFCNSSR